MPDILDHAKNTEMRQRQDALDLARQRAPEPPQLIIDGEVLCIDCEEPVPAGRLDSKPDAARCIDCQHLKEEKDKRTNG